METLKLEYEFCIKILLAKLNRSKEDAMRPNFYREVALDVVNMFIQPYLEVILKKSNFNRVSALLTMSDLIDVVIVNCGEALYRRPASVILSGRRDNADYNNVYKRMSDKRYAEVMHYIRVTEGQTDTVHTWSLDRDNLKQIQELEDLFSSLFRCFHKAGLSILVLDDDKLRKLAKAFFRMGLKKVFTRESGACPLMHMLGSLCSQLIFSIRLDRPGTFCVYITSHQTDIKFVDNIPIFDGPQAGVTE